MTRSPRIWPTARRTGRKSWPFSPAPSGLPTPWFLRTQRSGHLGTDAVGSILVRNARPRAPALGSLAARFPGLGVASRSVVNAQDAQIDAQNSYLNDLALGLILALAAVTLINTLMVATLERREILGLLNRVGATPRQLVRATALQAATVGAVGIALGTAAGAVGSAGRHQGADRYMAALRAVARPTGARQCHSGVVPDRNGRPGCVVALRESRPPVVRAPRAQASLCSAPTTVAGRSRQPARRLQGWPFAPPRWPAPAPPTCFSRPARRGHSAVVSVVSVGTDGQVHIFDVVSGAPRAIASLRCQMVSHSSATTQRPILVNEIEAFMKAFPLAPFAPSIGGRGHGRS